MTSAGDGPKRYMVIETFRPGAFDAVYRRFAEKGRMLPEGLVCENSWLSASHDVCWQIMATADPQTFDQWTARWSDLVEFEILPLTARPTNAPPVASAASLVKNNSEGMGMTIDLATEAKARGITYFLISFVDLFGVMRAKLVPASAIADMQKEGAGFAGSPPGSI